MRKFTLLCSTAILLAGCAPSGDPSLRAREQRPYPDPTRGTENHESQQYKTQILATPSPAGSGAPATSSTTSPATNPPAKSVKTPAPTSAPAAGTSIGNPSAGM